MDSRTKARLKAERKYMRRTVRHSLMAAACLLLLIAVFASLYPRIHLHTIRGYILDRRFDQAMTEIDALKNEEAAEQLRMLCRFEMACAEQEEGHYAAARTAFLALGEFDAAPEKAQECAWQEGERLMAQGEIAQAEKMYLQIPEYPGVAERILEIRYAQAQRLEESDPMAAFEMYEALGDYEQSRQRGSAIAMQASGLTDESAARAAMEQMSRGEASKLLAVSTSRDNMRDGSLCVGAYHTAGLRQDGSVVAVGRNDEGQCGVDGWTDIVQIAAGAYHTVGLRRDGTVAATGSNDQGQCNVQGWQGVTQIACGDYATFGLLSDGTVVSTGYLKYAQLEAWRNVTRLRAGSYMAAGVYGDGSVYASHPAGEMEGAGALIDVALTTGGIVTLNREGDVEANFDGFPGWTDVALISAGSQCILGVTTQGEPLAHFFRLADAFDPENIHDVVCACAGGGHSAFLCRDGRVYAFGDNQYGQCDVESWQLK